MEKDTEQNRAEIREELAKETGADDESQDPEGHEPLPRRRQDQKGERIGSAQDLVALSH